MKNPKQSRSANAVPNSSAILFLSFVALLSASSPAVAQDLSQMSIDDLVSLDITSVSKRPEKVLETPASVTIITGEDIRRSGVKTIWDALRLAPGVEVMKTDGLNIGVSIRQQNSLAADRMLVLEDGKPMNDPFLNNIFWAFDDLNMDDIDRIEVIRGAAGVLWGENAVSGLVNIITKKSSETQGLLVKGGGGTYEKAFGMARYGGELDVNTHYRTYLKATDRGSSNFLDSVEGAEDRYGAYTGGFRLDSDLTSADKVFLDIKGTWSQGQTVSGEPISGISYIKPGASEEPFSGDQEALYGHVLSRWNRELGKDSSIQLQAYYDHRMIDQIFQHIETNTGDIDFQHRLPIGDQNDLVWGAGYRIQRNYVRGTTGVSLTLDPETDYFGVLSTFINDEIELVQDTLKLSIGSKLTHNEFTGWEVQPSARLAYLIDEKTTAFAAYTRAVRTPSRAENDDRLIFFVEPPTDEQPLPYVFGLKGNHSTDAVKVDSYETGLRKEITEKVFVDIGAFFTHSGNELNAPVGEAVVRDDLDPQQIEQFLTWNNDLGNEYTGGEISLETRPTDDWRLIGTYQYLHGSTFETHGADDCDGTPGSFPNCFNGQSIPNSIFSIRSYYNVTDSVSFDGFFQWVEGYTSLVSNDEGDGFQHVPSYSVLDLRAAWKFAPNWELAVVGQNLIEKEHAEWLDFLDGRGLIGLGRSYYGELTYRY